MYKGVPQFICPFCKRQFKIRSLKKGFRKYDVAKWIKRARCPFCGKELKENQGEGVSK